MRTSVITLCLVGSLVAGCGAIRDSRANPFNWFGDGRDAPAPVTEEAEQTNPLIPRRSRFGRREAEYSGTAIDSIETLRIERIPGGAIIRATGLASRQGPHDVRLISTNEDGVPVDGTLTFRLEILEPGNRTAVGSNATRLVTVARAVTDQDLEGVRNIRVEGARNAKVARR